MLAVIKKKAVQMEGGGAGVGPGASVGSTVVDVREEITQAGANAVSKNDGGGDGDDGGDVLRKAILVKAKILKPVSSEVRTLDTPNAYELKVVAACFEGLAEEKRQQLAMTILRKEAQDADELRIIALTPDEATV